MYNRKANIESSCNKEGSCLIASSLSRLCLVGNLRIHECCFRPPSLKSARILLVGDSRYARNGVCVFAAFAKLEQ